MYVDHISILFHFPATPSPPSLCIRAMPPLKNLELEFPLVDSKFRQFCSSHGIFSVEDFLVNDLYSLAGYAEGEPTCEKLKQAIAQVLTIIDQQHQPWCNGLALLEDQQMRKRFLPTGCKKVDLLLRGGLREGEVVELVGLSSSGKTQLCLHVAAHSAHKDLGTTLFFDTGNSFSSKRISSFLHFLPTSTPLTKEEQESRFHRTMSSISCMPVFDIYELLGSLNWLSTTLKHQAKNEALRLRLVVIDSISSLIAPVLGGQNSQGRSLMVSVGYALKKLAYEYNICVLVTNHMVGGEGGVPKPALGESWKMVPHVRLLLSRDRGGCGFCVSVLKHASMPPGRPAKFAFRGDQEIEVEADRPPTESTTAREEHVDAPPPFFATRGSTYALISLLSLSSLMMGEAASSYVHMVQHLIEQCLLFRMTQEECVETLSRRAGIEPIVTSTVWKELERENRGFFTAYSELASSKAAITRR